MVRKIHSLQQLFVKLRFLNANLNILYYFEASVWNNFQKFDYDFCLWFLLQNININFSG